MKHKDFVEKGEEMGGGNRCEVFILGTEITDARLQFEDGKWFICQNEIMGYDCNDKLGYEYSYRVFLEIGAGQVSYLRPAKKTLYNLEEGDVLVDKNGDERMVLGVCGKVYFLSIFGCFDISDNMQTARELERRGYTIKGQEPELETVEVLGKTYKKEDVEKRSADIEEVKEH